MRRLICPYCFEAYPPGEVAFRCINPNTEKCPPAEDHAQGAYQRLPAPPWLPRVIPSAGPPGQLPAFAVCTCGTRSTKMLCPRCHNDLPSQYGTTESRTIALVGAKEAGKSCYIAVLIHELTHRVGHRFNASLNALDEQTRRRYSNDFARYLYEERQTLPATISARAMVDVRYPLVYRLSIARKKLLFLDDLQVTTLVFFDTAGEDLNDIDVMSTETRYLANSDGILFLLDPLQIPAVRQRLQGRVALPSQNQSPDMIVGRVAQLVRESRQIPATTRIPIPVALAFSKIDAVRDLVEPGSPIHRASHHDGYFDLDDAQRMNDSMRAYVAEWVGHGLHTFLDHNFKRFAYFGLSALGTMPDPQGNLPAGVAPFRVEDPFLWILQQHGLVPGRKDVRR